MSRAKTLKTEKIRSLVGMAKKARRLTVGSRETREGLHENRVRLVLVARDGSVRDRERLERIAADQGVALLQVGTRLELGEWVARSSVAVVGVSDSGLAKALKACFSPDDERRERTS